MIIDTHTHLASPEWFELLSSHGLPRFEIKPLGEGKQAIFANGHVFGLLHPNLFERDKRIEDMDEAGVDVSVLSQQHTGFRGRNGGSVVSRRRRTAVLRMPLLLRMGAAQPQGHVLDRNAPPRSVDSRTGRPGSVQLLKEELSAEVVTGMPDHEVDAESGVVAQLDALAVLVAVAVGRRPGGRPGNVGAGVVSVHDDGPRVAPVVVGHAGRLAQQQRGRQQRQGRSDRSRSTETEGFDSHDPPSVGRRPTLTGCRANLSRRVRAG